MRRKRIWWRRNPPRFLVRPSRRFSRSFAIASEVSSQLQRTLSSYQSSSPRDSKCARRWAWLHERTHRRGCHKYKCTQGAAFVQKHFIIQGSIQEEQSLQLTNLGMHERRVWNSLESCNGNEQLVATQRKGNMDVATGERHQFLR